MKDSLTMIPQGWKHVGIFYILMWYNCVNTRFCIFWWIVIK
jgi:hypothetical protein